VTAGADGLVPCDVLVPTCDRPSGLAVTLAGLAARPPQRLVVADQSAVPVAQDGAAAAMLRVLAHAGTQVSVHPRPVRRGVAEQRAFLLGQATSEAVLFLDDDVWLAPWALPLLVEALDTLRCGFVGMAVTGLSYAEDVRPHETAGFEPWDGPVRPERVRPGSEQWSRHRQHNAANPSHLASEVGATPHRWLPYKVAWVGGCVLYRTELLRAVGGFDFWERLPPGHAGEDVAVQLQVMQRWGGAGILPSGAVHLELPTTVPVRDVEAYDVVLAGAADSSSSGASSCSTAASQRSIASPWARTVGSSSSPSPSSASAASSPSSTSGSPSRNLPTTRGST
jgi:hypothetical protein